MKIRSIMFFFDSKHVDAKHVALLPRGVREVHLPFSGHFTLEVLKNLGLLSGTLRDLVSGEFDKLEFLARFNKLYHGSERYLVALAEKNIRYPARVVTLFRHACKGGRITEPMVLEKWAFCLLMAKAPNQALELLISTVADQSRPYTRFLQARAFLASGDSEAASRIAGELRVILPESSPYLAKLLQIGL